MDPDSDSDWDHQARSERRLMGSIHVSRNQEKLHKNNQSCHQQMRFYELAIHKMRLRPGPHGARPGGPGVESKLPPPLEKSGYGLRGQRIVGK